MKKFTTYLLIAVIAVVGLCFVGCGDKTYTDNQGLVYALSNGQYTVTSVNDLSITSVEIPEKIDGKPVTAIDAYVFYECASLKTVILPKSIKKIKHFAFQRCPIDSITLPENLKELGKGAFSYCRSLKEITLPNGVSELEGDTFSNCESLTKVTLSDGLVCIGVREFENCEALQSITLPQNVKTIGSWAFENCTMLSEIKLSSALTTIENRAFIGCSSLSRVTTEGGQSAYFSMPQSVTEIGYWAFQDCVSLTEVNIPDNVTTIKFGAFKGCTAVETIKFGNKVSKIEYDAFSGCSAIKNVYLPISLTEIEHGGCPLKYDAVAHYAGTEEQWDKIVIGNNNYLNNKSNVIFNVTI